MSTQLQHTAFGLSNMYKFYRVDAVVLVEGGLSRTVQEIHSGKFESESQDILFWQRCFRELGPQLRLRFWAVGSKPALHSIAAQIADGSVTHVYVAMDRDFDNLLGRLITSPKVLYTFGYSWENDVWNEDVMEEIFYTLCGVCRDTTKVQEVLAKALKEFERDLRWPTMADFLCVKHGIPLLPRQSPFRVITQAKHGNMPAMSKAALRQCVRDAQARKTGVIRASTKVRLVPLVDCCGHVVGAFGYSVLKHLFQKFCKHKSHSRDVIDSLAIDKLFDKLRRGSFGALRIYYEQQLAA
jgi:hypothetical protein